MTKRHTLAMALLLVVGLAASAQATHTESLVFNADCDGFQGEGILGLSSYIYACDLEIEVQAMQDGAVVATGAATVHIDERLSTGNPFSFAGAWDMPPTNANEAAFHLVLVFHGVTRLDETHTIVMDCATEECQVRRPAWWYRHPDAWPVNELTIGGCTLNKCQIRSLMTSCWNARVAKRLFRHTAAAMLNDLVCGEAPTDVIASANNFLNDHPRHQCLPRQARREARALKNMLREYNRRDQTNKAAVETDPEWDDTVEIVTWDEVKDLFR